MYVFSLWIFYKIIEIFDFFCEIRLGYTCGTNAISAVDLHHFMMASHSLAIISQSQL